MSNPLVIAELHADEEDKHYQLYTAAYGLEMQIDDKWPVELVLLAPPKHLKAVTKDTGVTGEDTAIVSAGVTDLVLKKGVPNTKVIKDDHNNWVSLDATETEEFDTKLLAASQCGCRLIVRVEPGQSLPIDALESASTGVLVLVPDQSTELSSLVSRGNSLRAQLSSHANLRVAVSGLVDPEAVKEACAIDGIDGVFLMTSDYDDFGDLLKILRAFAE